jgi:hypothetical protein
MGFVKPVEFDHIFSVFVLHEHGGRSYAFRQHLGFGDGHEADDSTLQAARFAATQAADLFEVVGADVVTDGWLAVLGKKNLAPGIKSGQVYTLPIITGKSE